MLNTKFLSENNFVILSDKPLRKFQLEIISYVRCLYIAETYDYKRKNLQ